MTRRMFVNFKVTPNAFASLVARSASSMTKKSVFSGSFAGGGKLIPSEQFSDSRPCILQLRACASSRLMLRPGHRRNPARSGGGRRRVFFFKQKPAYEI